MGQKSPVKVLHAQGAMELTGGLRRGQSWKWATCSSSGRESSEDTLQPRKVLPPMWDHIEHSCNVESHTTCFCYTMSHTKCSAAHAESLWKGLFFVAGTQPSSLWEDRPAPPAWPQWRSLGWHSSCCKGRASALGVSGDSKLVGTASSSMLASLHLLLVHVVLLNPLTAWRSRCPSLTLFRLAQHDPMEIGTAMLRTDWLEGRFSKTGTRSKAALWESPTSDMWLEFTWLVSIFRY
jgi:hypothetical protein